MIKCRICGCNEHEKGKYLMSYPPQFECYDCIQPERSKREDYKVTTITSYDCPKIEMPIDKDILTKYKWDSIDAVL